MVLVEKEWGSNIEPGASEEDALSTPPAPLGPRRDEEWHKYILYHHHIPKRLVGRVKIACFLLFLTESELTWTLSRSQIDTVICEVCKANFGCALWHVEVDE